jgi:hypothetical protein
VTPIFKANENNLFENCRPISVLTCFSKLLEKLMNKRLLNYYVEKHNILSSHQYGFRRNRSTENALLKLTDKTSKALDKGKYCMTIGVFIDLSKVGFPFQPYRNVP